MEKIGRGKRKYEEVMEEERGPKVHPRVPRSQGPMDQDISKSYSNTSLTLKKVHLVYIVNIVNENIDILIFTYHH